MEAEKIAEQVIERYCPEHNAIDAEREEGHYHCEQCADTIKARFKAAILEALSLNEGWIPVSERLPEYGQEVIVFVPKSSITKVKALARFIRYEGASEYYWDIAYVGKGRCHTQESVTHWMPLPEPPISSPAATDSINADELSAARKEEA